MPFEALVKKGRCVWYVYLLESDAAAGQRYVGITSDLRRRVAEHRSGKSSHTSKFMPWRLVT
jgi:putative endonuclease